MDVACSIICFFNQKLDQDPVVQSSSISAVAVFLKLTHNPALNTWALALMLATYGLFVVNRKNIY